MLSILYFPVITFQQELEIKSGKLFVYSIQQGPSLCINQAMQTVKPLWCSKIKRRRNRFSMDFNIKKTESGVY